jgi:hypothetical protein
MELIVHSLADISRYRQTIRVAARKTQAWLKAHEGDALDLLRAIKFERVGFHPIADHALNVIEQINQTFTYAVALAASEVLLGLHPEVGGFILAPGAHMSRELDIMSVEPGIVGAETFAAVHPRNNQKLAKDMAKLTACTTLHRYLFFASPNYPRTEHQLTMDANGVQVWSVAI